MTMTRMRTLEEIDDDLLWCGMVMDSGREDAKRQADLQTVIDRLLDERLVVMKCRHGYCQTDRHLIGE